MSYSNNTGCKRIFFLLSGIAAFLAMAGMMVSYYSTSSIFYNGLNTIKNISFKDTSFSNSLIQALGNHIFYCILILVLSCGFPGTFIVGGFLAFKAFLMGVAAGLAAKGCEPVKTIGICLGVFWSNIFIFPLYLLAFMVSLYRIYAKDTKICQSGKMSEGYLSFAAKIALLFALMCTAECVQTFIGTFVLNKLYQ